MNYSNTPTYSVLPAIVPEVRHLFELVMVMFAVAFYVGVHYRMHIAKHLVPPFYVLWLGDRLRSIRSRWLR